MSVIFLLTPVLSKIHNTSVLLKENEVNQRKVILNNSNQQIIKKELKNYTARKNYIIEISETLGEALNYIKQNYKNVTNLQVKTLVNDSIVGVRMVSRNLETMYSDLNNKNVKLETDNLESSLNNLMNSLNEGNLKKTQNIINSQLFKEYNHWKAGIKKEFI